jgi:uncharacterized protein DUF4389
MSTLTPPNPDYPARVEVDYPQQLSRLLIFVKWLLAIPHYFALFFLILGAYVVLIISWFAVLITGTYPEGMFNYLVGVNRWYLRVYGYLFLVTDAYPPFSLEDDPSYPIRMQVDYTPTIARWRPLVNWLLVIPAAIAAVLILFMAGVCVFLAWFAILITGGYPQGMFDVVVIAFRWLARANAFALWMTERYPPFVWA